MARAASHQNLWHCLFLSSFALCCMLLSMSIDASCSMRAFPFPIRRAHSLPGGGAEAGKEVGGGDHEDQGCQPLLVVVPGGLVPDRVGDWVRLIGYTGDGLGKREGGTFAFAKGGCFTPGRHGKEPLVCFACFLEEARVRLN